MQALYFRRQIIHYLKSKSHTEVLVGTHVFEGNHSCVLFPLAFDPLAMVYSFNNVLGVLPATSKGERKASIIQNIFRNGMRT